MGRLKDQETWAGDGQLAVPAALAGGWVCPPQAVLESSYVYCASNGYWAEVKGTDGRLHVARVILPADRRGCEPIKDALDRACLESMQGKRKRVTPCAG